VEDIKNIDDQLRKLQIQKTLQLEQDLKSGDIDRIFKAQTYLSNFVNKQTFQTDNKTQSLLIDPMSGSNFNYLEKQSRVSLPILRQMSLTPIPRAIITTRKEQVAAFCKPQTDEYQTGFIIKKKKGFYEDRDTDKISEKEKKEIDFITDFVLNCGTDSKKWHGDDFETFIRQFVEDSLALDQATFEAIRTKGGELIEFIATDGATYRIADIDQGQFQKKEKLGYSPTFVQVYNSQIVAEFYPWELCFGVRNPQTNLYSFGYGRSELEDLMTSITDMLNATAYNSNYFKIGSNPKGIIKAKNLNTSRLDEFKQQWNADMGGVRNAHKMPIVDADQIDFISTQQSNKDMEYSKYQEFLIKIHCAIYKISPEEIGFPLEGTNRGGLGGKASNKEELQYSKDKGLAPLLKFIESKLNKYIVGPISDDKYVLEFVGYDFKTESQEIELDEKKSRMGAISAEDMFMKYSKRKLTPKDTLLNPVYLQAQQMKMMGNPESNAAMGEEEEVDDNPFEKSLNDFIDRLNYE